MLSCLNFYLVSLSSSYSLLNYFLFNTGDRLLLRIAPEGNVCDAIILSLADRNDIVATLGSDMLLRIVDVALKCSKDTDKARQNWEAYIWKMTA